MKYIIWVIYKKILLSVLSITLILFSNIGLICDNASEVNPDYVKIIDFASQCSNSKAIIYFDKNNYGEHEVISVGQGAL